MFLIEKFLFLASRIWNRDHDLYAMLCGSNGNALPSTYYTLSFQSNNLKSKARHMKSIDTCTEGKLYNIYKNY